jgi:ribose transport system permease protein
MHTVDLRTVKNKFLSWSALPSLLLFVLFFIINIMISGRFNWPWVDGFIFANGPVVCVTVGVTAAILIGGIDISLGSIVSITNVILVTLVAKKGVPVSIAAITALVCATLAGVVNGFIIGTMRVNALLATFASSTIFAGIALWILPAPGGNVPFSYNDFFNLQVLGFIPLHWVVMLLPLIIWILLCRSKFYLDVFSLGQNEKKAYVSGVNVVVVRYIVHIFGGFCAGLAGLYVSAASCTGNPYVGSTTSMTSIAAAVIGGVSLSGGKGDAWGAVFGALFLSILLSTVVSLRLSFVTQGFVQGLILLFGVIFTVVIGDPKTRMLFGKIFVKKAGNGNK